MHFHYSLSSLAVVVARVSAAAEGQLDAKLTYFAKPKLLVIDELGYLPFEKRAAHLFFQLVARRYERGSLLITTNQVVSQWGAVFGDDVLAAASSIVSCTTCTRSHRRRPSKRRFEIRGAMCIDAGSQVSSPANARARETNRRSVPLANRSILATIITLPIQ